MTKDELREYLLQNRDATELDLSEKGITELPPEIGRLANLQTLDLRAISSRHCRGDRQLENLQTLDIKYTKLTRPATGDRPPGQFAATLPRGQSAHGPAAGDRPPSQSAGTLTSRTINSRPCHQRSATGQPAGTFDNPYGEAIQHSTDAYATGIGNLANLQKLYLSDNKLTALPPEIGQLVNLQILDLGDNQLTALPPEISNSRISRN